MKWDGYGATIRGQRPDHVAGVLAESLGGLVAMGRPRQRYGEVFNVDVGPRTAAWVGMDSAGQIYVEGKGETSPQLVHTIREQFPGHSAPRLDVCEDFDGEGAFHTLQNLVRSTKGPRVKGGYVALPDDLADGRTWTAGVRGGVSYLRLYEAGKHPDRVLLNRPHWVRAELEVRPHYARDKQAAATMSPTDAWGMSSWSHNVGQALMQVPVHRFEPEVRQYSYDKTTRYLALTFRRHWEEMLSNGEDIVRTMQGVWQEEDEYVHNRKRH